MRIIRSSEIEKLGITSVTAVEWVKQAFLMKNDCQLPPKISLHPQGTDFFNTMPCILPEKYHTFGCKIVSRIKGNQPALKSDLLIYNTLTGKLEALIDADWITSIRTGAVAALAINTLRSSMSEIYSFVGLGVIGQATLKCFLDTNSEHHLVIRLKRYKNHAEETIEKFNNYKNVSFQIVDTMDDLVKDADVIISCITDANGLLVDDINLFKPGVLIVPVHTRGFQNCDKIFDKVIADDEGHVKGFKYFPFFHNFRELSDVLSGNVLGRESDKERILSYNIGLGLHDVFFGRMILDIL